MASIDHPILKVAALDRSVACYEEVLGFECEGQDGPFTILRVSPTFVLQLAPCGTGGMEHVAFALEREAFDPTLARLKAKRVPYAPRFDLVGKTQGIGREAGARGSAPTVDFSDPDRHLIETRTDAPQA